MKKIIIATVSFFMLQQTFAKPKADTVSIFINAKKVLQQINTTDKAEVNFVIKKMDTKKIKQMILQLKGQLIEGSVYTRALAIGDDNSIAIAETKDKPGYFNIFNSSITKQLLTGKKIPVYLALNPADQMRMMPSKRMLLGNLIMQ